MDSSERMITIRKKLESVPESVLDFTTISIGRDLKHVLDELKVTPRESYHAEIKRLLMEVPA
jgi:hypothetical protein